MLVTFQEQWGRRYSLLSLDILVCLKKSKKIGHIRQFHYFFIDCYLFIYLRRLLVYSVLSLDSLVRLKKSEKIGHASACIIINMDPLLKGNDASHQTLCMEHIIIKFIFNI